MYIKYVPMSGQIILIGSALGALNTNATQLLMSEQLLGRIAQQVRYTPTILGRTVYLYGASDARPRRRSAA